MERGRRAKVLPPHYTTRTTPARLKPNHFRYKSSIVHPSLLDIPLHPGPNTTTTPLHFSPITCAPDALASPNILSLLHITIITTTTQTFQKTLSHTYQAKMDHPQTPRILAPHLSQFQHRIVRILGKVVQLRGETAVIDAGGNVDVILTRVRAIRIPHPSRNRAIRRE
jgi:hypothetical protein